MTILERTGIAFSTNTDAQIRALALFIRDAFTTCGFVQTADTGQLDPATVLGTGTTTSLTRGYYIFRANDALATRVTNPKPLFIKFEIGVAGTSSHPMFVMQLGTGSDGAGNLTGLVTTRQLMPSGLTSATQTTFRAAGDGSYLNLILAEYVGFPAFFMCFDRTRDPATGAPTGDGWNIITAACRNGTTEASKWHMGYSTTDGLTDLPQKGFSAHAPASIQFDPGRTTGIEGNDVLMAASFGCFLPAAHPTNALYAMYDADLNDYQNFVMTTMGAARTYRVLPAVLGSSLVQYNQTAAITPGFALNYDLAVRYE